MNTGPEDLAASGSLPAVVSNYLAASDRDDIDAIVACFTDDAVVHDEDRHWRGAQAIRQWRESVATAYEYTVALIGSQALGEVDGGQRHEVYTHLEGNFPGGQVDLTNRFTLRGELIVGLQIVPTAVT
jgi:ketosteroid isomerase-like protein